MFLSYKAKLTQWVNKNYTHFLSVFWKNNTKKQKQAESYGLRFCFFYAVTCFYFIIITFDNKYLKINYIINIIIIIIYIITV